MPTIDALPLMPHLGALFARPDFERLARDSHFGGPGPEAKRLWTWHADLGDWRPGTMDLSVLLSHFEPRLDLVASLVGNRELVQDVGTILSLPGPVEVELVRGEPGAPDVWVVEVELIPIRRPTRCTGRTPWEAVVVAAAGLQRLDLVDEASPPETLGADFVMEHGGIDGIRFLLATAPTLDVLAQQLRHLYEREDVDEMVGLLDLNALPTFSANRPGSGCRGFLSYDATRVLRYSEDPGLSWHVEPRSDLDE